MKLRNMQRKMLKKAGITVCENMLCCAAYVITDTHCPHCGTSKTATQPE